MLHHKRSLQSVVRARVCSPRLLSARSGEDDLLLGLRLATAHPTYAADALDDPDAMDSMRSEYLEDLVCGHGYREAWWSVGHLEQKLYRRVVKDAHARWAPKPRYEDVPGISTGNGAWPRPEQLTNGQRAYDGQGAYDDVYGVTVNPSFEYLIGGDGKRVPIWEDERFIRRPKKVFQVAARNGQIPSVYQIGTPERPYYSSPNKDVSFPDAVGGLPWSARVPQAPQEADGRTLPQRPQGVGVGLQAAARVGGRQAPRLCPPSGPRVQ